MDCIKQEMPYTYMEFKLTAAKNFLALIVPC